MAGVSEATFWDDLYARGGDGWEMGQPHPALADWLATTPPPRGRVAVPGAGRGHDARLLARHGHDVVAFDFSPAAVEAARALARQDSVRVDIEQRDIFTLARDYAHAFDGAWEYTCFCAIEPRRRAEYVRTLAAIVKPGGWLLAMFFPMRRGGGGPPFPVSRAEVRRLLAPAFRIERAELPLHPVPRRLGLEWLVFARRIVLP
jgi:SAM-dependent methyltransferase